MLLLLLPAFELFDFLLAFLILCLSLRSFWRNSAQSFRIAVCMVDLQLFHFGQFLKCDYRVAEQRSITFYSFHFAFSVN